MLPIVLRDVGYVTHIEALAAQAKPEALVVIGAGAVGLEFGQMYARFGTKVTILRRSGSIYRRTEARLAHRLAEILRAEGITVVTNAKVESATRDRRR